MAAARNVTWRAPVNVTLPTVVDGAAKDPADVALTLLAERGFDAMSMVEIAAATGIPADEFVRTIGTKEAIVLAVAEDMLVAVVNALDDIDAQTPMVEALMTAHSRVVNDIIAGKGVIPVERMRCMSKAITSSRELQQKVAAQRTRILSAVLADHFGTSTEDRRVTQGLRLWSAVLAATYQDVLDKQGRFNPDVDAESAEGMRTRLNRAFRIVTGRPTK